MERKMERTTIAARDVKVGDVLEGYGKVDQAEADEENVMIGWIAEPDADPETGDWGDFAPDEKLTRLE